MECEVSIPINCPYDTNTHLVRFMTTNLISLKRHLPLWLKVKFLAEEIFVAANYEYFIPSLFMGIKRNMFRNREV